MLLLPTAIYLFHIPYIIYFLCYKQTKDRFLCIKLSHLVTRGTLVSYAIFLALVSIIAGSLARLLWKPHMLSLPSPPGAAAVVVRKTQAQIVAAAPQKAAAIPAAVAV